jgi:hypothetical protein
MTLYEDFYFENLVKNDDTDKIDIKGPKSNPLFEKWIKLGLASVVVVIPIPGLVELIFFIYNTNRYKCFGKCSKHKGRQKVCHYKCRYLGAKWTIEWIKSELELCNIIWSHEPKKKNKCNKKIGKLIPRWEAESLKWKALYEGYLAIEKAKCEKDKEKCNKLILSSIKKQLRFCKEPKCYKVLTKLQNKYT